MRAMLHRSLRAEDVTVTAHETTALPTHCVRCHRDCGATFYHLGTLGPLCEICVDNLQRHEIEVDGPRKERETFTRWIGRLLGWWQ